MSKEYPILFSGAMVQAILSGHKTQTRRLSDQWTKVKKGDRLWVRETWQAWTHVSPEYDEWWPWDKCNRGPYSYNEYRDQYGGPDKVEYRATSDSLGPWNPSIHMPRWASRITLVATEDARREPLQDITPSGVFAEGVRGLCPVPNFTDLWDSLNRKPGQRSSDNPDVSVVAFSVEEGA